VPGQRWEKSRVALARFLVSVPGYDSSLAWSLGLI
jgi:hypothetical protein